MKKVSTTGIVLISLIFVTLSCEKSSSSSKKKKTSTESNEVIYTVFNQILDGPGRVYIDLDTNGIDDFYITLGGPIDTASIGIRTLDSNKILCAACHSDYLISMFYEEEDIITGDEYDFLYIKVPAVGVGEGMIFSDGYIGLRLYEEGVFSLGWIQISVAIDGYSLAILDGAYYTNEFDDTEEISDEFYLGSKD